ncbi:hypothetical protein B2J93_4510 [Marssonina coronariae]|uniref:Uncharacterized protein n=1 Tax=Diplocarpon coronariae TaxID=2795749 RepID=A0A218Z9U6_9HELO|nr:hypothetical protein B2J93_4510 [Marssonina coronariae]
MPCSQGFGYGAKNAGRLCSIDMSLSRNESRNDLLLLLPVLRSQLRRLRRGLPLLLELLLRCCCCFSSSSSDSDSHYSSCCFSAAAFSDYQASPSPPDDLPAEAKAPPRSRLGSLAPLTARKLQLDGPTLRGTSYGRPRGSGVHRTPHTAHHTPSCKHTDTDPRMRAAFITVPDYDTTALA